MAKYTIGVDFGTLSARALLVDTANGRELACAAMDYPHGVMDRVLCTTGEPLPPNYALQHPADYLAVLSHVIPAALREAGVDPCEVVGVGVDFTSCTLLPVDKGGTPLCLLPTFEREPLAYVLLWKHHAAKPYAEHLTEVARTRGERFLSYYGGKMDDQWTLPKLAEVMREAPAVYAAADRFLEGGDFVVQSITDTDVRSYHFAAYKTQYSEQAGYPSAAYLDAAYPAWSETLFLKLRGTLKKQGCVAGYLNADYAARLGLCEGTPVAVPVPDAHSAAGALGMGEHGDMFAVLGTSGCFMAIGREELAVPGICGSVKDGILPGTYGYESGLCSLGDHFAYAAEHLTSPAYVREAAERGIGMLPLLLEKAAGKRAGESGVLALNWFNGNRSVLINSALSGCFVGLTLATAPEDLLRALLEATAFGARNIIENFEKHGLAIRRLFATGGIARKDPFTMQLYADVLGREIVVTSTAQAPARGAAIGAAVAAGVYADMQSAIGAMRAEVDRVYLPRADEQEIYDRLYAEYKTLHDYFGRGENDVMARLRAISAMQAGAKDTLAHKKGN